MMQLISKQYMVPVCRDFTVSDSFTNLAKNIYYRGVIAIFLDIESVVLKLVMKATIQSQ